MRSSPGLGGVISPCRCTEEDVKVRLASDIMFRRGLIQDAHEVALCDVCHDEAILLEGVEDDCVRSPRDCIDCHLHFAESRAVVRIVFEIALEAAVHVVLLAIVVRCGYVV